MPPLIGITCSALPAQGNYPAGFRQHAGYVRSIAQAGGLPVLVPLLDDPVQLRALYDRLDGVLLPGGGDVDPLCYGEPLRPDHDVEGVDPRRDRVELALARWALADERPLLGVCRGQQLLNVAAGGTLYQDIERQVPSALTHDSWAWHDLAHALAVEPDSRLAHILGATTLQVNTLHHQAVARVACGLRAVAHAPDGVIEALEHEAHPFALAVQFHPEELTPDHTPSARLFAAFVAACER